MPPTGHIGCHPRLAGIQESCPEVWLWLAAQAMFEAVGLVDLGVAERFRKGADERISLLEEDQPLLEAKEAELKVKVAAAKEKRGKVRLHLNGPASDLQDKLRTMSRALVQALGHGAAPCKAAGCGLSTAG